MTSSSPPLTLLSACLIVRDEASRIDACLEAVCAIVDEVVVLDTGSRDDTVRRARGWPVEVIEGGWSDDFAAARNEALSHCTGEWVLSLDADEVVHADRDAVRRLLVTTGEERLLVPIENRSTSELPYVFTVARLFRRAGASWQGRVHERITHVPAETSGPVRSGSATHVPEAVLHLVHHGYATAEDLRRKGVRNAELAQSALDHLIGQRPPDRGAIAAVALDLGRACIGSGELQRAVAAFEAVRELEPSGLLWQQATDFLARVLLGAGETDLARVLAEQLRSSGGEAQYCDWLTAQAQAQSGDAEGALERLQGVRFLVDPAGRRYDHAAVEELRGLCSALLRRAIP
jgi:hypothetical protein